MEKTASKNLLAKSAQMVTDSGLVWALNYFVVDYETSNGQPAYGIRVNQHDANGTLVKSEETYAVTESHDTANAILDYLCNGVVPPCVLNEFVDEWFSENLHAV